jgi:hypothetical protein
MNKNAVVCCIAKNEELYINEWINYHLTIGFKKVYIYDNSDDNILKFLNNKNIIITHLPGKSKQFDAYNHFFKNYSQNHTWCAVIDCDEFIVLKKHNKINDFLNEYLLNGALGINWVIFGSNGHSEYYPELVRKRFTRRQKGVNKHIKCIVCCKDVIEYNNPHYPTNLINKVKDCDGNIIEGPFNESGSDEIIQINHYFTKSKEEFDIKRSRGMADTGAIRTDVEFAAHDLNDIEEELII